MTYSCMSLPNPAGRASRQLLWTVVVLHVAARAGGAVAGAPPSFAAVSTGSSRTSGAHTAVCLRLRGGSAIQQQQRYSVRTTTDEVPEDERKPELKRAPSVLVLDEAIVCAHTHPPPLPPARPAGKVSARASKSTRLCRDAHA